MALRLDVRVVVGGMLGLLAALVAEEVIQLVPLSLKPTYITAIFVGVMVCLFYLSGLPAADIQHYRRWRRRKVPWPIGIISGYEYPKARGRRCRPAYSSKTPEDWIEFLERRRQKGKPLFVVKLIHSSEVHERFAVVFNPFGEVFPDSDLEELTDFRKLVDFVRGGGVFVNCGGYPFYYNWNYGLRRMVDTTPRTTSISVVQQRGIAVTSTELFHDSLAFKHFGLFIKNGTVTSQRRSVHQSDEDKIRFGDLTATEGALVVKEFRALEKETPNLLPGLRSQRDNREVYPLAAVQVGDGYIVSAGMEVASDREFKLIALGVESFLWHLQEQLTTH